MGYVQDLINQGYGGYAGWGEAEAKADFGATGGQGKYTRSSGSSSGGGGATDYSSILAQQRQYQEEQAAKYAGVLESQIPSIQQRTAESSAMLQQKESNLKDRYSNLISQIKGKEQAETATTQTNLSTEYGKRGIPLSSGMFQQDLAKQVSGIGRYWTDKAMEAQNAQSSDILDLQSLALQLKQSETDAINNIKTAIATRNWEGAQSAITTALELQKFNEGMRQFDESSKLKQKELSIGNRQIVNANGKQLLIDGTTGQVIADLGSAPSGGGGSTFDPVTLALLQRALGGDQVNQTESDWEEYNQPTLDWSQALASGGLTLGS